MKFIKKIFKSIYAYFFQFTKKGKEEKYWLRAEEKLNAHLFEKGAQEIKTKQNCIETAKKITKKKRLSNFHLSWVVSKKHKKELQDSQLKIDTNTLKFKNA